MFSMYCHRAALNSLTFSCGGSPLISIPKSLAVISASSISCYVIVCMDPRKPKSSRRQADANKSSITTKNAIVSFDMIMLVEPKRETESDLHPTYKK